MQRNSSEVTKAHSRAEGMDAAAEAGEPYRFVLDDDKSACNIVFHVVICTRNVLT
jgi:hypothetical protein